MVSGVNFKNPFTGSTVLSGRGASEEGEGAGTSSRRRSALADIRNSSVKGDKSADGEPQKEATTTPTASGDGEPEKSRRDSFPWYENGESSRMAIERVQKERAAAGLPPLVLSDDEGEAGPSSAPAALPAAAAGQLISPPPPSTPTPHQSQLESPKSPKGRRLVLHILGSQEQLRRWSRGTLQGSEDGGAGAGAGAGGGEMSGATTLAGSVDLSSQNANEGVVEGSRPASPSPSASASPPPPPCHKRCVVKDAFVSAGNTLMLKKNKGKGRAGCALDCRLRQSRSWEVVRNKVKFPEAWWRAGWLKK